MWHSGSISTFKAHVWLYPDAGIGIFAGLAGPQRYDTTDVLYDLMYAISDLVVFGVRPPPPNYGLATPRPDKEVDVRVPPRPLSDYTGAYVGQWLEMNATVSLDQDASVLRLTLGRLLTAELRHYDCVRDEFDAVVGGRLWWVAEGQPDRAVLSVKFRSSVDGGRPDVLELPLEMDDDSVVVRRCRFTRPGLRLADDWTTLDHDNKTCLARSATCFIRPQTWMFVSVIFSYSVLTIHL